LRRISRLSSRISEILGQISRIILISEIAGIFVILVCPSRIFGRILGRISGILGRISGILGRISGILGRISGI